MSDEDWKLWNDVAISRDKVKLLRKKDLDHRNYSISDDSMDNTYQIRDCCIEYNQECVWWDMVFIPTYRRCHKTSDKHSWDKRSMESSPSSQEKQQENHRSAWLNDILEETAPIKSNGPNQTSNILRSSTLKWAVGEVVARWSCMREYTLQSSYIMYNFPTLLSHRWKPSPFCLSRFSYHPNALW